jgi:hypothetical protein
LEGDLCCREAEVLSMFAMIINKLKGGMAQHVPAIFKATFECTLNMIKGNYVDYPEHRLQFFSLLQAITNHCFPCLQSMSPVQQQLLIDSIVWAFRHTERNVADTGLNLLSDMLNRFVQERELMGPFLKAYYCRLLQDIFAVMTDTMHKPGFRLQARRLSLSQSASERIVQASRCCIPRGLLFGSLHSFPPVVQLHATMMDAARAEFRRSCSSSPLSRHPESEPLGADRPGAVSRHAHVIVSAF